MKKRIKSWIGRTLFGSGLHRQLLRNTAVVVTFHRVSNSNAGDGLTCNVDLFVKYCRFFSDFFRVIAMRDLLKKIEDGIPLDRDLIITFDDGYRDNYELAAPILRSLGLPGTFFLTSQFIGSDVVPWWDGKRGIRHPWMKWDEVRWLHAEGFEIGAHTRTHANLAEICGPEAREEILGSRRDLEEQICAPVDLFAYPYGKENDISEETREMIKAAGFRCCCSCFGGVNSMGTDPYHVRRIPISSWYTSAYHLGYELALGRV